MSPKKHRFTDTQKVYILRHHLLDKAPISDICTEYGIHSTQFYRWQKTLFENGTSVFSKKVIAIKLNSSFVKRI